MGVQLNQCISCGEGGFDYHGIVICDECRNNQSHIEEIGIHLAIDSCYGNPRKITHYHAKYSDPEEDLEYFMEDHGLTNFSDRVKESIEEVCKQWLDEHEWEYLVGDGL